MGDVNAFVNAPTGGSGLEGGEGIDDADGAGDAVGNGDPGPPTPPD